MGEGGWIENDEVEDTIFFREAWRPVEQIAVNEIVRGGIEFVEGEIAFAPFEIFFGEVEAGGAGTGEGGTNGKSAGVGEGVQDFLAVEAIREKCEAGADAVFKKATAIVTLIEEEADGVTLLETDFVADAVLKNRECF